MPADPTKKADWKRNSDIVASEISEKTRPAVLAIIGSGSARDPPCSNCSRLGRECFVHPKYVSCQFCTIGQVNSCDNRPHRKNKRKLAASEGSRSSEMTESVVSKVNSAEESVSRVLNKLSELNETNKIAILMVRDDIAAKFAAIRGAVEGV
jgi:hypothetical protein